MRRSGARALVASAAAIASAVVGLTGAPAGARPTAAAAGHAPIGAFDTATARFGNAALSQPNQQTITFSGWAADQDLPGSAVEVHLYLDGQPFQPVGTGRPRPDVDAAVPWAGPSTGWSVTMPIAGFDSSATICAHALNQPAGGPTTLLGCYDLARTNPNDAVGSLDAVTTAPGLVRLRGWAGDPDGYRTTRLRVYYDHAAEPAADAVADLPRPDVRRAFPRLSPTTGFDLTLPIAPGAHSVCVLAQNTGPAGFHNADLGCARVAVADARPPGPHDPRGTVDRVRNADGVSWRATGWAYDPDSGGPVQVRVRSLVTHETAEFPFIRTYRRGLAVLATGVPRPGVQAAFPAAGPNAGFDGPIVRASSLPGATVVCAYALNVGPGSSRLIGCK